MTDFLTDLNDLTSQLPLFEAGSPVFGLSDVQVFLYVTWTGVAELIVSGPDIEQADLRLTESQARILRDRLDAILGETRATVPDVFTHQD